MRTSPLLLVLLVVLSGSCAEDAPNVPTQDAVDTVTPLDAAGPDGGAADVPLPTDLGPSPDAFTQKATSWGVITGACGQVSAAMASPEAALFQNVYTFSDGASFDPAALGEGPKKRFEGPNAGGSSKCSEVMSMQLLIDCEGGSVLKTETEVSYDVEGKKTDYIASVGGLKAGVSVTRAYLGPVVDVYTLEDATNLLEKKLAGSQEALANVSSADQWDRSILHIWTLHADWAQTVATAWEALDVSLKQGTLVLLTVEEGGDLIVTDSCDD